MNKTTIIGTYNNEEVQYSYTIQKAENVRVLNIERVDKCNEQYEERSIIITKIDCWYFMSCPALGTAAPGIGYICYDELVADMLHDLGFESPDIDAFTHIILEIAEHGF